MIVRTTSADETRAVGAAIASCLDPGVVVVLGGDLGSGKTTLAQGIAAALGVTEPVVSPTFAIVREYEGRVPVTHVDVYRLDRMQELHDLGFEEMLDGAGVVLIEWGDLVAPVLPGDRVVVRLQQCDDDDDARTIAVTTEGADRSAALMTRLARARSNRGSADLLLLAIDTSTRRVGVALGSQSGVVASIELGGATSDGPPRHAEELAPAIQHLLSTADLSLRQLSAVAVAIGPGMFTGLRVGVTTAKVIAQALRIPVIPVPSLDLVAYPLRHASGRVVLPTLDARRNELYCARYRPVPGGLQRETDYELVSPRDLLAGIDAAGESVVVAGDGALRFREQFELHELCEVAGPSFAAPSLSALMELASSRFEREDFATAADVVPMYLRRSDAEIAHDRRPA